MFDVIDLGQTDPYTCLAAYAAIAERCQDNDHAALLFAQTQQDCICVGAHQNIDLEVDTAFCQRQQIPIIRRHAGGGTVLLQAQQLFFQWVLPRPYQTDYPHQIYQAYLPPIVQALQTLGINAKLNEPSDISLKGKKITGSGAASIGRAQTLVGNIIFDFNYDLFCRCLKTPSMAFTTQLKTLLPNYVGGVNQLLAQAPSVKALKEAIKQQLPHPFVERHLTTEEQASCKEIIQEELQEDLWIPMGHRHVDKGIKLAANTFLIENEHGIVLQQDNHSSYLSKRAIA